MRKLLLSLAALAVFGLALPTFTSAPANAEVVVVKHRHGGWHHHYGWHHHHGARVYVR